MSDGREASRQEKWERMNPQTKSNDVVGEQG